MMRAFEQPDRFWDPVVHESAGGGQPGSTHVWVVLQTLPPVQSASRRHCTHVDVAPWSRHLGVGLAQGVHDAPQA